MVTAWQHRKYHVLFGAWFGAWLGIVYAFCSQAVNWLALPGIPLAGPAGGLQGFIFLHLLLGAALGFTAAIPNHTAAGVVLGGLLAAFLTAMAAVSAQWGDETVIRTIILLFYTFLPLAMLFMPLAFLIRRGVDAQTVDPDRPYLWARRFLVPLALTLAAVGLAAFSLYPADIRRAFRQNHEIIQLGLEAGSSANLPRSLEAVQGFRENAIDDYEMYWSDNPEAFFGPRPATGEMSQFLIFTQFKNGYRVACVFSATTTVPNCTNQ